jgi:predicted RNA-binding Zn-ribbon protein involved in translation (DUF1610 family)
MVQTDIIECTNCRNLILIAATQKSRTCPYCGVRIEARRANKVASAEDAFTASKVLRGLKEQKKLHRDSHSTR